MSNSQLAEINASLQAMVHRAYDLGKGDALKKIGEMLDAEPTCSEQLALAAPEKAAGEVETAGSTEPATPPPWWAWRVK